MADKDMFRAAETQKHEIEDEKSQMFAKAKLKMMKLRKEKEAERLRYMCLPSPRRWHTSEDLYSFILDY